MAYPSDAELETECKGILTRLHENGWFPSLVTSVVAAVLFLATWQGLVMVADLPKVLLPTPREVWMVLQANTGSIYRHITYTGMEVALGWLIGVTAGILLAILMALCWRLQILLYPYVLAIRIMPLVVLAPLLIMALGPTLITRVLLAAILTFFPVTVATLDGLRSVPKDHLDLGRLVNAPSWKLLLYIQLPNALPEVFVGLKLAAPLAVEAVIIAEFLAATRGIGFKLLETARLLQTPLLFAYLCVLVAFGLLIFGIVVLLERIVRWDDRGSSLADQLGSEHAVNGKHNRIETAVTVTASIGFLSIWQVAATVIPHASVFLSPPTHTAISLASSPWLFVTAGYATFVKLLVGWLLGAAVGFALGALVSFAPSLRSTLYPYLVGFRVMPQIAIAPILLVWLGISFKAAVVMVATSTFFPITISAATGLSSMPEEHRTLLRSVDAPVWRRLISVRLRYAVPSLFAGIKLSVVTALAGTVVAEWFVAERGLGVLVLQGMADFLPTLTLAASVCLFVLGGTLFTVASAVQRYVSW